MRKVIKYVALFMAFMLIVGMALKFGFKEALVSFVALIAFAVYALLDNLDYIEAIEDEKWDEFLENLQCAIDEIERKDNEKGKGAIGGSEGDAEDDA